MNVVMGVMSIAMGGAVACGTTEPCNPAPPGNEVGSPQIHAYGGSTAPVIDGGASVLVMVEAAQAGCAAPATNPSADLLTSSGTFAGTGAKVTVELKPGGDGSYVGSAALQIPGQTTTRIDVTIGQVKACRFLSPTDAGGGSGIVEQDCAP